MHHLESAQHQEEEKVPLLVVILSFDLIHENFFFSLCPMQRRIYILLFEEGNKRDLTSIKEQHYALNEKSWRADI